MSLSTERNAPDDLAALVDFANEFAETCEANRAAIARGEVHVVPGTLRRRTINLRSAASARAQIARLYYRAPIIPTVRPVALGLCAARRSTVRAHRASRRATGPQDGSDDGGDPDPVEVPPAAARAIVAPLLTEKEVAETLGCSVALVRKLRARRLIGYVRVGKAPRFTAAQVEAYLKAQSRPARPALAPPRTRP